MPSASGSCSRRSGDSIIPKVAELYTDLSELGPQGKVGIAAAAAKLKATLDVEKVTKKFYEAYKKQHALSAEEVCREQGPREGSLLHGAGIASRS